MAGYLGKITKLDPQISTIISMVIVFVVVQAVFVVLRRILDLLLDLTRLTWLDRIFGAVMGVGAGALVVVAVVQALLIGVPDWPLVKTSKLVGPVDRLTSKALTYAPKEARDQWLAFIREVEGGAVACERLLLKCKAVLPAKRPLCFPAHCQASPTAFSADPGG